MNDKRMRKRRRLMAEHGGRCVYCGLKLTADQRHCLRHDYATLDHVVPRSRGGLGAPFNRTIACRACNQAKGDMLPEEFLMLRAAAAGLATRSEHHMG